MEQESLAMPKGKALAFGIYLILLNLALVYILLKVWPETIPPPIESRS